MVERKEYLAELVGWKDEQVIKVVTGIRRCGKSTLLAQYQDWLRVSGVTDAQIVLPAYRPLTGWRYRYADKSMGDADLHRS